MKKKIACLSLLFVGSLAFLSGCNETSSTTKTTKEDSNSSFSTNEDPNKSNSLNLTQDELFEKWVKGRDYLSSFSGNYSLTQESKDYQEEVLIARNEDKFGRKGNEFYQIFNSYRVENDNETLAAASLTALKNIEVDGNPYSKLYMENSMGGVSNKQGSYVSPDYLDTMDMDRLREFSVNYSISSGNTYSSFVNAIRDDYASSEDEIDNIIFSMDSDIIDLTISSHGEYVDEHNDDEDYEKTTYESVSIISCKDDKLISFKDDYTEKECYSSEVLISKETANIDISYEFDQELFDSISIETEETKNYYYAPVSFDIEGYPFKYSDDAYVYQSYDASKAKNFIVSNDHHFIIASKDYPFADYLEVYLDKDYMTPFTSKDIVSEERINLYAKFNLPEDLAIVIIVFKNTTRSWIYLAYPVEVGKQYDTNFAYSEYDVYSIDGVPFKEGDSRQFECKENKAYVVVFDTPELLG